MRISKTKGKAPPDHPDHLALSKYQDGELPVAELEALAQRIRTESGLGEMQEAYDGVLGMLREYYQGVQAGLEMDGGAERRVRHFDQRVETEAKTEEKDGRKSPVCKARKAARSGLATAKKKPETQSSARPAMLKKAVMSFAAITVVLAAWMMLQGQSGQEALAAFAERIKEVSRAAVLRQYSVTLIPEIGEASDAGENRFQHMKSLFGSIEGTLHTLGRERFVLIQSMPAPMRAPRKMFLGGQGQKRWFYMPHMNGLVETDTPSELPQRFMDSNLFYMEMETIISQLEKDCDAQEWAVPAEMEKEIREAGHGVKVDRKLRLLRFCARKPETSLRKVDLYADQAAEIHRMELTMQHRSHLKLTIKLQRAASTADPQSVFEAGTYCPPGTPRISAEEFFKRRHPRFGSEREKKTWRGSPDASHGLHRDFFNRRGEKGDVGKSDVGKVDVE